jgi:hypothetical protein
MNSNALPGVNTYGSPFTQTASTQPLPPDPECRNDERAEWAGAAISAFQQVTRTDDGDAPSDLLCDLRHWCDRNGFDFDAQLARAMRNYDEETLA